MCVKRSFVANSVGPAAYRRFLFDKQPSTSEFYSIKSQEHNLHTTKFKKSAFSPYDDKRYLLNSFESYACGHFSIPH